MKLEAEEIDAILRSKFPYYSILSELLKKIFVKRVRKFIKATWYESRSDLGITADMQVLIAASAMQITMGFEQNYILEKIERIIIYPKRYYSPFTKTQNIGEMNMAGILVISWEDFLKGLDTTTDGHNVVLHESAHALQKEKLLTSISFTLAFDHIYLLYKKYSLDREAAPELLRNYAYGNKEEFFAVGTEAYFEQTTIFQQQDPALFFWFAMLYKQDPRKSDLSITDVQRPVRLRISATNKKIVVIKDMAWLRLLAVVVFGTACINIQVIFLLMPLALVLYRYAIRKFASTTLYSDRIVFKSLFKERIIQIKDLVGIKVVPSEQWSNRNKQMHYCYYYLEGNTLYSRIDYGNDRSLLGPRKEQQYMFAYLWEHHHIIIRDERWEIVTEKGYKRRWTDWVFR
ncbi:MAG: zinc-dependent peptidase [Cytophagales bacterium]|nr:zinc-dependent peptidase [Cytophaga sp.]